MLTRVPTMDALTLSALLAICAPDVHPGTARALIAVESSVQPHAIGVIGGVLERQPRTLAEAQVTAAALARDGWNFDAGLAQINRHNFDRLGLTTESVFEPCTNLRAMQAVLRECHARWPATLPQQMAVRRTLSCYHNGNPRTGFVRGYVQKVVSVATRTEPGASGPAASVLLPFPAGPPLRTPVSASIDPGPLSHPHKE